MSEFDAIAAVRLTEAPARRSPPTLEAAVAEFEAYYIGELLRMANRSSQSTGLLDGGPAGRTYRELFFEEIGRLAARHGGLGLAESFESGEAGRAVQEEEQ